jgi:hypothetical protein
MSTKVNRTVVGTRADFDELYVEPARERWARERALEPEDTATPDASESGGVSFISGAATRASSVAADSCTGLRSEYYCGPRYLGRSRTLPGLQSEQPELDEAGSGHAAVVSGNADSSWMSSTSWSDSSSSTQYTPDASSSESNDAGSSDSEDVGSSDSDDASSSDFDDAGSSDSDSVANESSEALPLPASSGTTIVNQRPVWLEREIEHARQFLRDGVSHSYGEYRASVASVAALERELEQLRSSAYYLHGQRIAELERAIDHGRQSRHTAVAHSYGEYRASLASLAALERELEQLMSGAFYSHRQ